MLHAITYSVSATGHTDSVCHLPTQGLWYLRLENLILSVTVSLHTYGTTRFTSEHAPDGWLRTDAMSLPA